jgi:N-acetylneuraminic acid mutarotase
MILSLRPLGLFLLLLSLESAPALAQCPAGRWVTLAPMNEPRQELAAAQLGGKIYAVAGLAGSATANEIYDPASDHWSFGADFPTPTDHAWAVAFEGLLYVGGGTSNRAFSYDPAADAWTEIASSTHFHGGTPAAAVLGGRIVVAGGTGGGMAGNEVEAYDPATDEWTLLAPMSCARNHTAGGVIGGKLYVAGGRPGSQSCLEVYDPAANTWTMKAPMPTGRSGLAGAAVGNCLYTFGGEGNTADPNGIFHEVEAYDPAIDAWTELPPMQTGRHGIYAAVLGNVIYLPGGATQQGFGVTGVNEAYVIGPSVAPRRPVILSSPRGTPRVVERE